MVEDVPRNNVVTFPTVISNGKKEILETDITPEEAKQMAVDKVVELGHTSNSVFALCIDKETGTPTIIMGGFTDPSWVNMFLDLVKDELKEMFRASNMQFRPDDTDGDFGV